MSHIGFVDFEAAKPPPPPEPVSQWPENLTKLAVGRSVKHRDLTKAGDIPPHAVHPDPLDPSFLVNCFKFCTGITSFQHRVDVNQILEGRMFLPWISWQRASLKNSRPGLNFGTKPWMKVWNALLGCRWNDLVLQNYTDLLADLDHGMPVDVHFSLHCLVLATTMRNSR